MSADPKYTDPRIERAIAMAERLAAALETDIASLEAGRPQQMRMLEPEMQHLSAHYTREAGAISRDAIEAAPPALRARLTAATGRFQEALALHARVLTRMRNASEGLVRAVAQEVEKRRNRARPYAAPQGARSAPAHRPPSSLIYNAVV